MNRYYVWVKWNYAEGNGEQYEADTETAEIAAEVTADGFAKFNPRGTTWSWMRDANIFARVSSDPSNNGVNASAWYFRVTETPDNGWKATVLKPEAQTWEDA